MFLNVRKLKYEIFFGSIFLTNMKYDPQVTVLYQNVVNCFPRQCIDAGGTFGCCHGYLSFLVLRSKKKKYVNTYNPRIQSIFAINFSKFEKHVGSRTQFTKINTNLQILQFLYSYHSSYFVFKIYILHQLDSKHMCSPILAEKKICKRAKRILFVQNSSNACNFFCIFLIYVQVLLGTSTVICVPLNKTYVAFENIILGWHSQNTQLTCRTL